MTKSIFLVALSTIGASAMATPFVVDATANSTSGGVGLATITLNAGDSFTVTADSNDLWSLGPLPRWTDADGLTYDRYATGFDDSGVAIGTLIGSNFGTYVQGGLSAAHGSLVGSWDQSTFFLVGSNYSGVAAASGTLYLYNFDSNNADNAGAITANVEAVPEPATMAMLGLGAAAFLRRRRA